MATYERRPLTTDGEFNTTSKALLVDTSGGPPPTGSEFVLTALAFVVIAVPGTPVPCAASETLATRLILVAGKTDGATVGDVHIGDSTLSYGTKNGIPLASKDYWEAPIPAGDYIDVAKVFIDGPNAADGVTIFIDPYVA